MIPLKHRVLEQTESEPSSDDERSPQNENNTKTTTYSIQKDCSDETEDSDGDKSPNPGRNYRRPRGRELPRFWGEGELLGEFEKQYRRFAKWERQEGRDAADMLSFYL